MTRWLVVGSALAAALVFGFVGAEGSRATVEVQTGVVASVYDGDTLSSGWAARATPPDRHARAWLR